MAEFGLYGLAVMGQNFALNVAEHGFKISVCNRSPSKVDVCVERAKEELGSEAENLTGYKDVKEFVDSLAKPRKVMFLVKAGAPVDACIDLFLEHLEKGDVLIDGGNEWFENTIRRTKKVEERGILYMAMGVSGGEEGARHGPSLMPGGPREGFDLIKPIIEKCAAQTDSGPCTTYIGGVGSGNYVKMVHNGIEYGDMQLIAEAYTVLRVIGQLENEELSNIFADWNSAELDSFLIEITAKILAKKDTDVFTTETPAKRVKTDDSKYLVDAIKDRTGNKGTGKMTIKEGADRAVAVGTMAGALDARFISYDKEARAKIAPLVDGPSSMPKVEKEQLIEDVKNALYASKICSYAQGMNLIREASNEFEWGVNLGECARIWKGGCIIRAKFLDRIKAAYDKDAELVNLIIDPDFKDEIAVRQRSWRRVVTLCAAAGIAIPSMYSSLAYFDQYRRETLMGASLVQAQRDFFGSHTFERKDMPGSFHCKWTDAHAIQE